jgi:hypothetical protein
MLLYNSNATKNWIYIGINFFTCQVGFLLMQVVLIEFREIKINVLMFV